MIEQNRVVSGGYGITSSTQGVSNLTIMDNEVSGGSRGISFGAKNQSDIFVYDNYVHDVTSYGIATLTTGFHNLQIIGNRVENTGDIGIWVSPIINGGGVDLVVSDNQLRNIASTGIDLSVHSSGTATVTGNTLDMISGHGILAKNASGTSSYLISDNHLTDVSGTVFHVAQPALLAGSTGNTYTDTEGGLPTICLDPPSGFIEVTVNGVLQTCP